MTTTESVIEALISSLKEKERTKGNLEATHHLSEALEWLAKAEEKQS